MRLLPSEKVKKIIQVCHDHKLYMSTGGFVERVIVQGGELLIDTWRNVRCLGLTFGQVSSGLASIPVEDQIKIVKQVQKLGMKPKPEVSMMIGAGAGTHIAGYEAGMKLKSFDEFTV